MGEKGIGGKMERIRLWSNVMVGKRNSLWPQLKFVWAVVGFASIVTCESDVESWFIHGWLCE